MPGQSDAGMVEHIITGTLVYAITRCGACGLTWEQPGLDLSSPGWIVCPHCVAAAPAVRQGASNG